LLLATNVVSELVAREPAPQVVRWMTAQTPGRLFLSVITLGELTKGVARLDPGRRRHRLTRWLAEHSSSDASSLSIGRPPLVGAR
jgi:tRNA(fMet)-specific endonuclease VapC